MPRTGELPTSNPNIPHVLSVRGFWSMCTTTGSKLERGAASLLRAPERIYLSSVLSGALKTGYLFMYIVCFLNITR